MKKSTFYFSHDYNAANDVKILFLRQKYGMEGYGVYWFLIESLAQSNGILPMNIIPVLAMQMQVQEHIVKAIINDFDLFVPRETKFISERLLEHLNLRNTLSEKGKKGAIKRWSNSNANGVANGDANSVAYAKERKGNKGNKIQCLDKSKQLNTIDKIILE